MHGLDIQQPTTAPLSTDTVDMIRPTDFSERRITIANLMTYILSNLGGAIASTWAALQTFSVGIVITSGGVTITAGGLTVTAGGATITAGGLDVKAGGANIEAGGLTVGGLTTTYANNAAALTGGLTAGQFYRITGADTVAIVH